MRRSTFFVVALGVCALAAWSLRAQVATDALERGFNTPPSGARPRVWWHWMNGNITKDGITADLEWMKRIGLGGVQNFDASLMTPQIVDKRLVFMTPEWKDAFAYAVSLADRLGLEFGIAGSPGWSESGGPWVKPEQAMKKIVWSETRLDGGQPFTGALPKPPSVAGPFQTARPLPEIAGPVPDAPDFYRDVAVLAFATPRNDLTMAELKPAFSIRGAAFAGARLFDGDLDTIVPVPMERGQPTNLDIDLGRTQAITGVSVGMSNADNPRVVFASTTDDGPALLASENGTDFRPVARLPRGRLPQYTVGFPAVRARYFRLSFSPPPGAAVAGAYPLTEVTLYTAPRVQRFEDKAGFAPTAGLAALQTTPVSSEDVLGKDALIDLTSKMQPDGTIEWSPPPGRWTVLRVGYSLTGKENGPATAEATGLEVDKLSASAVKAYFTTYLDMYRDASRGLMGKKGVGFVITDSWEAGTQNWTDDMAAQFARRRGYDLRRWLPALTGRIVESAEATDKFLWDFRATIADLTIENHYEQLTTLLRERGMGRYSESHESRRALIADGMDVKRSADVPMSAMWTGRGGPLGVPPSYAADIRESASVAHIYGQNIVAAESLTAATGAYSYSPETLKATADAELSQGLNRFVIHTSVHQPLTDKKPGIGLGPFGQWFTRQETWAELAGPWITYLARSSFMLQQGRFAADVLYYYGDDSNVTALFGERGPDVPASFGFDYASTDVVLNRIGVSNGLITTSTGMRYRALALDPNARMMAVPVLRKIRDLVNAGAVLVGPRPVGSPGLMDDQSAFKALVDQLWGARSGVRTVGRGKMYADTSVADALAAEKVMADFEYTKPQPDTALLFVHRTLPDGEIYWVNNRRKRVESVEATFRVSGKTPEFWHADSGLIEPASYRIEARRTVVPLRLEGDEAVFVVFRKAAPAPSRLVPVPMTTSVLTVDGPWSVTFQTDRGAPASAAFPTLTSWSERQEPGIKYFSGSATYTKTIDVRGDALTPGAQLWLDLGDVKNIARVAVNGRSFEPIWHPPFRVNVASAVLAGSNRVEITVTNLWVNRIIGDQQPNAPRKYTFTSMPFYAADSPLLPSGLLGPVQVMRVATR